MVSLGEITEENWMEAAGLGVAQEQRGFVAPAIGILARGYVYRACGAHIFAILRDGQMAGLAMTREFSEEPLGYELQQLMIDRRYQRQGIGAQALRLVLEQLRREGRWPTVEVCVKKADEPALRLYEKAGFVDTGYLDPNAPDAVNLILRL